ncbi:ketosteroid isomerase-like protein [Streptacidiphilus sp. MAP12-16]|uniref:nuclear transport factor 2 family protein n=1 Tax=Streptacidiphilus sp. MAP12-16 TaxID=3156300 RepID=UPI003518A098
MSATQVPAMFEKDLAQLRSGDIEGMLSNYHPDAQIMRLPDTVATGTTEIRAFLEDYVALNPKIIEVMAILQADDCVLYHSTIEIAGNVLGIVGTWVLRDGLIWRQTAVIVPASPEAA